MEALEAFLRTNVEPLQYAAFFGALLLFGVVERIALCSRKPAARRRRWPLNFGITALNVVVISALPLSGIVVADYAQSHEIGVLNNLSVVPALAIAIGIALRSLVSWATHLAMHKVPVLWRVHRVHHTDTFLDVSTTVRFHPIEFLINSPILLAAILAMGISPVSLLLYELFDAAMAVFTHANMRLPRPIERMMRWLLVTPEMHRIHHSVDRRETDSNYGATLSIWDHLFRTHRDKPENELASMDLGLTECQDVRSNSALWVLKLPFMPARIPHSGNEVEA